MGPGAKGAATRRGAALSKLPTVPSGPPQLLKSVGRPVRSCCEASSAPSPDRPLFRSAHGQTKSPAKAGLFRVPRRRELLDLGFLEFDMLAHDRIVFLEAQLLGLGARVLLGDVVEPGVSAGHELDFD